MNIDKNEKILFPFWKNKFKNIKCGFTLPSLGNQTLTRESISSGKSTKENRIHLANYLSVDPNRFFYPHQIHSDTVILVDEQKVGRGATSIDNAMRGDACVTNEKNILLIVTWADCVPVIFFDPVSSWIGVVHSGWKSTVKNIIGNTIDLLINNNVDVSNIFAAVGPGIRDCCYLVCNEFKEKFSESGLMDFFIKKDSGLYFDLSGAVYQQLVNMGIKKNKIDFFGECTCCSKKPFFFSFRKDKENFEGQAAFIGRF